MSDPVVITVPLRLPDSDPAYVYRCMTSGGSVLYIGSTSNPVRRMALHRDKPWWPEIAFVECEGPYRDRTAAFAAEREAIRAERPPFNLLSNPDYTPGRKPRIPCEHCGRLFERLSNHEWRCRKNPHVVRDREGYPIHPDRIPYVDPIGWIHNVHGFTREFQALGVR